MDTTEFGTERSVSVWVWAGGALDLLGPGAIQNLFHELISRKCFVRINLLTKFKINRDQIN